MSALKSTCQIARTLDVIGEKWSLLIVRNALRGQTRFSEFHDELGVPTDILTNRLAKLVDAGVLEKRAYRQAGDRARSSYHLTPEGEGLRIVIAAMLQWGDEFNPAEQGPGAIVVGAHDDRPLRLGFLDEDGREIDGDAVAIAPGSAARSNWEYRR